MNFFQQFKTLSREDAKVALFAMLDSRAMTELSNMQESLVQIDEAGVDGQYHEDNPKIDLHNKHSGAYIASTNWSKTVKHAVSAYEKKNPAMVGSVRGYLNKGKNESVDESLVSEEFVTLEEGVRKVDSYEQGRHKAVIHKDSDTGEYCVKFHTDGKHLKDADYFTDDKIDGISTAEHQINQLHEKDGKKVVEGINNIGDDEGLTGVVHTYSVGEKSDKSFKQGKLFKTGENKYTTNFYAGGKRIPKSNKDFTDRNVAIKHIKDTVNGTR